MQMLFGIVFIIPSCSMHCFFTHDAGKTMASHSFELEKSYHQLKKDFIDKASYPLSLLVPFR